MSPLLYLLLLLLHTSFISADLLNQDCGSAGNYTANSTYKSNLIYLLNYFSSINSTFTTHTNGSNPDNTVYGLILCRGDVTPSDCNNCIQNAAQDVLFRCPNSKQATVWYDYCQLRYSNLRFFSSVDDSVIQIVYNVQNISSDPDNFSRLLRKLINKLTNQAAYSSSGLLFATGIGMNGSDTKVNGLVQCTRDLSMDDCYQCLQQIHEQYRDLEVKRAGRVLAKSCKFMYDIYSFYQGKPTVLLDLTVSPPPPLSPPVKSPPPPSIEGKKDDTDKVPGIVIPIVVVPILLVAFFLFLVAIFIFLWRRKKATKYTHSIANMEEISSVESLLFDLSTLKVATDNFSEANKLGEGGFGSIYKGKLEDRREIAVKRLSTSSTQGLDELKNELFLLAKLQHRNLVKLLGVCLEEEEKLLVYEYVPNRSLDNFLFDPVRCKQLTWERRFNIIGGIARGLFYVHEESHLKVIHRDLKASNILLDKDMNPKISDFGLARLFGGDETQGRTSRVVGTFGYMAPEYALHGHFSSKVDVFSYGVLALEIVTGSKCSSFYDSERAEDFLNYVYEHWRKGTIIEIVDPSLENCSKNEALRCIHIALLCVQEVPAERPPMSSVVVMLHSPSEPLQLPLQPRFIHRMLNSNMLPNPTDRGSTDGSASR